MNELKPVQIYASPNLVPKTKPGVRVGVGRDFGVVYAVEYGDMVKIGSTMYPDRRMKALASHAEGYSALRLGAVAITPYHTNYKENEKIMHNRFYAMRKAGSELFQITLEEFNSAAVQLSLRDDSAQIARQRQENIGFLFNYFHG